MTRSFDHKIFVCNNFKFWPIYHENTVLCWVDYQLATCIPIFCALQTSIALVYSESIEKLKGVLQAMQNASQKREKLEKQLREQLQSEISRLKESNTAAGADSAAGGGAGRTNSKQEKSELQQQILLLETEVAKVCADVYTYQTVYLLAAAKLHSKTLK